MAMKYLLRLAIAVTVLGLSPVAPSLGGTPLSDHSRSWLLDLSTADVSFAVRVLGVFTIRGEFEQVHGGLRFDAGCTASTIRFSIDTASVSTSDSAIEKLLRGPDLLNADRFPVISFTSTHIVPADTGSGRITGQLGLNGINREISFELRREGDWLDSATAAPTRFRATTRISRTAFGITALPIAVSDSIDITVVIDARPQNLRLAEAAL